MKNQYPLNFLIIEDNPGDLILLERNLRKTNLPISHMFKAEKMQQAIQVINDTSKIDLTFLDLSLPDSNGIESFIELNRHLSQTPIIILSGLADAEIAVQAISLGAQDYLIKGEFDDKLLSKSVSYSIERKKNEEKLKLSNLRYEMVNRATNDIISEWDYRTNSGAWGEGLMKIFGYPEDHLIKKDDWAEQYLHPDDAKILREKIKFFLQNKQESWQEEFRFRCADGSYKLVLDRGFIVYDDKGNPNHMYGAMTDITEQRRLEKELAEQRIQQQKIITEITISAQEKERNEIGKELHDNVNQVLATVKMFLNLAQDNESLRMDMINRSFENVNHAISEIRKLSKSLVAPSLTDMGLQEAVEELAEEINSAGNIHISVDFEKESTLNINAAMQLMLYRIIQEAMNNILKYANASQVLITVRSDAKSISMAVKDDGVGFDPSKKAKGIGLKNIQSRVEFHCGTLNVVASPGMGCTLEIKIPLKPKE